MSHNDGLPSFICNDCVAKLNVACAFRELCQKSYTTLCQVVRGEHSTDATTNHPDVGSTNPSKTTQDACSQTEAIACLADCDTDLKEATIGETKTGARNEKGIDEAAEHDDDFVPDDLDEENEEPKEEEKSFECKECSKAFAREKGLRVHSLVHKQKPICKICNKSFTCTLICQIPIWSGGIETRRFQL